MQKGNVAVIFNGVDKYGIPKREGKARLLDKLQWQNNIVSDFLEYWRVEFENEPGAIYHRFVFKHNIVKEGG